MKNTMQNQTYQVVPVTTGMGWRIGLTILILGLLFLIAPIFQHQDSAQAQIESGQTTALVREAALEPHVVK